MEVYIRFAENTDVDMLKNIWKICFGDSDDHIARFMKRCFKPENTVVATVKQKVVGVIYLLPAMLETNTFIYGYAIGVLPEYRGNDICKKMHEFVFALVEKNGWIYGLHPANEKLHAYYKRTGLNDMYALRRYETSAEKHEEIGEWKDLNHEEYEVLRRKAFSPIVRWKTEMLSYILDDIRRYGGFVKAMTVNGAVRFLTGYKDHQTLYVKETSLTDDEIFRFSGSIKEKFQVERIIYMLPLKSKLGRAEVQVLGIGSKQDDVYMNLFMD